jgi:hypothetical protein
VTELSDPEATRSSPFEGDVFGGHDDYINDDFGKLPDTELAATLDDDDKDDNQEDQMNLENGWEPERPGAHTASPQTDEDPPNQQVGGDDQYFLMPLTFLQE